MRTVSGATTGMNYPWGIAYRAATDELYVVNYLADAGATDYSRMNVFARKATNASPSTIAPVRSLKLHNVAAGSIPGAQHIALSASAAQMIVSFNEPPYAVVAYPIAATNDDAAAWWIQGGGTGVNLQRPSAVTVEDVSASDYRVFVGTGGTQPNTVYGFESMNVNKSTHDVVGSVLNSMLNTPAGLSIDPVNHELFVANRSSNAIAVFNSISMANSPKRALLSGAATGLSTPVAVGFESNGLDGNIHVLNANNHSITKYSSQYSGNTGPDSTVSGLPSGSLNGITVCN